MGVIENYLATRDQLIEDEPEIERLREQAAAAQAAIIKQTNATR